MPQSKLFARRLLGAVLLFALVAGPGCAWFRTSTGYETSREHRPLEVPPEMSRPVADPTMQVPSVSAPAATLSTAATRPAAAGAAVSSFEIADSVEGAWRRVGLALERIDGARITGRAQLLGSYEVEYRGETVLVRIQGPGDVVTVSVVGAGGEAVSSGPPTELLGLLRQRLG